MYSIRSRLPSTYYKGLLRSGFAANQYVRVILSAFLGLHFRKKEAHRILRRLIRTALLLLGECDVDLIQHQHLLDIGIAGSGDAFCWCDFLGISSCLSARALLLQLRALVGERLLVCRRVRRS